MKGIRFFGVTIFLAVLTVFVFFPPRQVNAQTCKELESMLQQAATVPDYEQFIAQNSPCELAFVAVQRLASAYVNERDWPAAINIYKKYKDNFPAMGERFEGIIELLAAPEQDLHKARLGKGINSRGADFRPVITADGRTLYFTRNRGEEAGGEDIYYATRQRLKWQKAANISTPISTPEHEMILGVSADKTKLTLFGNYPGSFGRGDIFFADRGKQCWSEPQPYPAPINSENFESDAMLPADGRTLLFVSDRPGNIGPFRPKETLFHGGYAGNTDIYVYVNTPDGKDELINLGETINTPFGEYSPFLHPDGKTLYFSSEGHYGLGGLDVFVARRQSDSSWTDWSEPVNLGKEINGPYNDWGFQITTEGDLAYYATAEKKTGCWVGDISTTKIGCGPSDIYSTELPIAARPAAAVAVFGKVTDPDMKPLQVQILWNDLTLNKSAGEAKSDPDTGDYFIVLPAGHRYGYSAEKEGYMGSSEALDFTDTTTYAEYEHDIILYPMGALIKDQIALRLNNIFFDFNKHSLRPESSLELDRWVGVFTKNGALKAEIHGHTCWVGTEEYNQKLSERRASAVIRYLVKKGVDPSRLTLKGFGETRPAASNETNKGRELNRRVEILFK